MDDATSNSTSSHPVDDASGPSGTSFQVFDHEKLKERFKKQYEIE